MHYTRADVSRIFRLLFPEPLGPDEYVSIPNGDPNGGKWNLEHHVKDLEELLGWLDDRPEGVEWNYGLKWTTIKISKSDLEEARRTKGGRTGGEYIHRAWGCVVDIEDSTDHTHLTAEKMVRKVWEKPFSALPDWVTAGAEFLGYTGGGLHAYVRFSEPVTAAQLAHLLYQSPERPGAFCDSYDWQKNRWIDRGSFERGHGQRLIGTKHPKHQVITKILRSTLSSLKGHPIDPRALLEAYAPRIRHIEAIDNERARKRAERVQAAPGDNAFETVKASVDMIEYFGLRMTTRGRGRDFTQVFCPLHDNQNTPAASVKHSDTGDRLTCFGGCHDVQGIDVFDLWERLNGGDKREALEALAEHVGIPLARYSTPKNGAKAKRSSSEVVDVRAWLTGNGADLDRMAFRVDDKTMIVSIPFNVAGRERTLSAPFDAWKSTAAFKAAVITQLWTSFSQYPKPERLFGFFEASLIEHGPEAVKDERVNPEITDMMKRQLLFVLNDAEALTPEQLHEWARHDGIAIPDTKPDWWEDAGEFFRENSMCAIPLLTEEKLYVKPSGLFQRLRGEFGNEWTMRATTDTIKKMGFQRHRRRHAPDRRVYAWELPIAKAEALGYEVKK